LRANEIIPNDNRTISNLISSYLKLNDLENAKKIMGIGEKIKQKSTNLIYNIACIYSRLNNKPKALEYLEKAIKKAEKYKQNARTDIDFDNIKNDDKFKELIK